MMIDVVLFTVKNTHIFLIICPHSKIELQAEVQNYISPQRIMLAEYWVKRDENQGNLNVVLCKK